MVEHAKKISLPEKEIPKKWYNILADLPVPLAPPLDPATGKPMDPSKLERLFSKELIAQEMSTERWIDIPEEVLDVYTIWRPTPLIRARHLEAILETPAEIYFKNESVSPAGSHKPNSAVPQVYYNKKEGIKRMTTETGAGQWGSALSLAGTLFEMPITVYMVRCSYDQKPYRRSMIEAWGGEIFSSPSNRTEAGRRHDEEHPDSPGSLGVAISEAVEDALNSEGTHYGLGSVLNHVMLHQTIIGEEARLQMAMLQKDPDVVIGCVGGGSNFAGISFPFLRDKIAGNKKYRIVGVEPSACPTMTKGLFAYDFGDTAGFTPLLKMYTLGHDFLPPQIHAGGLRYHGLAPLVSLMLDQKLIEAVSVHQRAVFEAAILFARSEGILPAPESAHAIRVAVDEALMCKKTGEKKVILFNLSGHGHFDLSAYDGYLSNTMRDYELPQHLIEESLRTLPKA